VTILYKVRLGTRRRVERVSVAGNHYFDSATLNDLLSVHAADAFDRHGAYSQALVAADLNALRAVYQNNGFSRVRVTPETNAGEANTGVAPLTEVYRIEEGEQLRVGTVRLE
jgi:outer membrane protein assembly factor BamA